MEELNEKDVLTDRIKALEQQLEDRNTALIQAGKDIESFTYKLSHDFHAPLRAISSYMEIMQNDFGKLSEEDAQRMIFRVVSNAEEMKKMLDGLLEFVRVGKKEVNIQLVNITNIVKQICDEMQRDFPDRKIVFTVNDMQNVEADEDLIKKAWQQLISNAVKFTGKNDVAMINIHSEDRGDEVVYSVEDNGVGFDMNFYSKLFGIFQKLHHKTEFEGTGIGLAIVQKIIAFHKGKIWAEAKVKEGASFYFSLPKRQV